MIRRDMTPSHTLGTASPSTLGLSAMEGNFSSQRIVRKFSQSFGGEMEKDLYGSIKSASTKRQNKTETIMWSRWAKYIRDRKT
jgi:hypothetical protein